jgi:hypothetical protein
MYFVDGIHEVDPGIEQGNDIETESMNVSPLQKVVNSS